MRQNETKRSVATPKIGEKKEKKHFLNKIKQTDKIFALSIYFQVM